MYQFHPQHQRVKEIIASGEIGDVKTMKATLSSYLENQNGNIRMNGELGEVAYMIWVATVSMPFEIF
ncbi:hypothetical protein MUB15_31175 [Priestia sp. OVS21]|nr:hypothetical protein [Priestia sp. OVS21]MCJ7992614.1 hypothetical protein [Priestia sp. OVS21]